MANIHTSAFGNDFDQIGWRYYNKIKKKAMEQEFSWSGLLLSLSIAFFVVIISAFCLGMLHNAVLQAHNNGQKFIQNDEIQVEARVKSYLPVEFSGQKLERFENLNLA